MEGSVLKARARELIFKNTHRVFFVSVLFLFCTSVLSELIYRLPGTVDFQNYLSIVNTGSKPNITMLYRHFRPLGALLAMLLYLFQPVLDFGFFSYCVKITRNQDAAYKDLLSGFQRITKVITIFLISFTFIFLWSLLFIVPGIIAAYKYRLAYYISIDDPGKSALQCIEESIILMNGGKLDLLIIDLSFIGWYILNVLVITILPLPFNLHIILIWVLPYRGITNAAYYENRKGSLAV